MVRAYAGACVVPYRLGKTGQKRSYYYIGIITNHILLLRISDYYWQCSISHIIGIITNNIRLLIILIVSNYYEGMNSNNTNKV
jgi:hypothetical protein